MYMYIIEERVLVLIKRAAEILGFSDKIIPGTGILLCLQQDSLTKFF